MTGKKCSIPLRKCVIPCELFQTSMSGNKKGLNPDDELRPDIF